MTVTADSERHERRTELDWASEFVGRLPELGRQSALNPMKLMSQEVARAGAGADLSSVSHNRRRRGGCLPVSGIVTRSRVVR